MSPSVLLEDFETTRFVVQESQGSEEGSRTSALGVIQRADTINGNNRIYPKSFFERLFRPGSRFMERVAARGVCGHIEHPSDGLPDLRRYAVVLTDVGFYEDMRGRYPSETERMRIDSPGNAIVGRFEALSTPDGKIVEALWVDEVQTGSSSRAQGNVVTNESSLYPQFPTGVDIVLDDVDEESLVWDIVARPSTPGAFPERVREAIQEAIEVYKREALQETQPPVAVTPPIGEGLGGSTMNSLSEIRARLSRVKPQMEDLDRQPRRNLVAHLQEVDSLLESLNSTSKSLNESQELPAADMRGELQALRDRIMSHVGAAFAEADTGKLPGATPMKVAPNTTSNYAAMNSDPRLQYPSSQSFEPGGRAGAGAIQEPDAGTSDQSVPGAGVDPSGDVSLDPEQKKAEKEKQAHGKMDGEPGPGAGKGVSGASMGTKAGAKESITTDQAHQTTKGELGQPEVKQKEEGEGMEVDEYGRSIPSQPVKAGKTGSEDGKKLQGIVASQQGSGPAIAEGEHDVNDEALANLNMELVAECRALRKEASHWREKYERATALVTETGQKFRQQRFKMAMERLIENNPTLDEARARAVLETARDETHMVQIAEALLGTRARISQAEEKDLSIKVESDGFYRLMVNGEPHARLFDGASLYEALMKMGIAEVEIQAEFDKAHGITEMEYELPPEYQTGEEGEEMDLEVVALVPLEPVEEPGEEGDLDMDMDYDIGAEGGEDGEGAEMLDIDLDVGGEGGEEEFEEEDEEVTEADYRRKRSEVPPAAVDPDAAQFGAGKLKKAGVVSRHGERGAARPDPKATEQAKKDRADREAMDKARAEIDAAKKAKEAGESLNPRQKFILYAESRKVRRPRGKKSLTEAKKNRRAAPGARRLSEAVPPAGGKPSSRPPQMQGAQQPSAQMSLTERVIAREQAEKKKVEEARRSAGFTLNG
jgi:hypothetical protein